MDCCGFGYLGLGMGYGLFLYLTILRIQLRVPPSPTSRLGIEGFWDIRFCLLEVASMKTSGSEL